MSGNRRKDRDNVIERIQKLLALSQSDNENEAQTALLHAQKWMAKYNLEMKDIEGRKVESVVHGDVLKRARRVWWETRLASIIADNFRCYHYNSVSYGSTTIVFLGKADDVEIATQVFNHAAEMIRHYARRYVRSRRKEADKKAGINSRMFRKLPLEEVEDIAFENGLSKTVVHNLRYRHEDDDKAYRTQLVKELTALMRHNSGAKVNTTGIRNDYVSGFLSGLQAKFAEQVENEDWGLVLVKDKDVVEVYDKMTFTSGRGSSATRSGDAGAMSAGFKRGKSYGGAPAGHLK